MVDLNKKITAESQNIEKAINNLKDAINRKEKTTIELAAIATFLHNIYNGIENILKQLLKAKGIDIPKSQMWHKELLETSVNTGVISKGLSDELYEYLTFRHFFVHAYGFMLEEIQVEGLANNIPDVCRKFFLEIERVLLDLK